MNIRSRVLKLVDDDEAKRAHRATLGLCAKPGRIYTMVGGRVVDVAPAVAKFLPSSPWLNGVRMRYERGRLVPRVRSK